jgi:hypothetical protein
MKVYIDSQDIIVFASAEMDDLRCCWLLVQIGVK